MNEAEPDLPDPTSAGGGANSAGGGANSPGGGGGSSGPGGGSSTGPEAGSGNGSTTRRRILDIALALMSQRGVDGTSMRDLASAAGLNVASLYHYFPSKADLLEAVLVDHGFLPLEVTASEHPTRAPEPDGAQAAESGQESDLAGLIEGILDAMFRVEDFVRLMIGEAMRSEETARSVGHELFSSFEASIEAWVRTHRPDLDRQAGAAEVARLTSAMVIGLFVQHAAGALPNEDDDLPALIAKRAAEAARVISPS